MLSLLLAAAQQAAPLDDLRRRSASVRSLVAEYSLSMPGGAGPSRMHVEYVAPSKLRIELGSGDAQTTMWCVDGVQALAGPAVGGRAGYARVLADLDPLEQALVQAFPDALPRAAPGSAIGFGWTLDPESGKVNFTLEAQLREPAASPFGWLETLARKGAAGREDGGLLRFETDGAFELAVSKEDALLRAFTGRSPKGELRVELVSARLDEAIDPARFTIGAKPAAARDVGDDLLRAVRRFAQSDLRRRIYATLSAAGADPGAAGKPAPAAGASEEWAPGDLERAGAVWRAFHRHVVVEALAAWIAEHAKILPTVAKRIEQERASGKGAEEVEAFRQRERGYLVKQLDARERELVERTVVPHGSAGLPRAAAILAEERRIVAEVFRAEIREPVLAEYDRATAP